MKQEEGVRNALQDFFEGFRYLFAPFNNATEAGINIEAFADAVALAEFELEKRLRWSKKKGS